MMRGGGYTPGTLAAHPRALTRFFETARKPSTHDRPAHTPRIAPARCPDKPRSGVCGHCAGPSRPAPPAAWGDGVGPRRLRVPDLTPSTSKEGEVGNTTAL